MVIRSYCDGDEKQLVDLYNRVFKGTRAIESWRWEFKDNPAGQAVIYVAEDKGLLIGHCSAIPVNLKIGQEVLIVYYILDTMIHPDYRGKGIAKEMGDMLYEVLKTKFTFSCVNEAGLKLSMNNFGFFDLGPVPRFVRTLEYPKLKFLFYRGRTLKKIRRGTERIAISKVNIFEKELNGFWQRVANNYSVALVKDMIFLNWRYVQKPKNKYEKFLMASDGKVIGYFILERRRKAGIVIDLAIDRQDNVAESALKFISEYFVNRHVKHIFIFGSEDSKLKESGFILKGCSGYHFIIRPPSDSIEPSTFSDRENWSMNYGDIESL